MIMPGHYTRDQVLDAFLVGLMLGTIFTMAGIALTAVLFKFGGICP